MPQYFDARPEVESRRGEVTLDAGDRSLRLATDRGVFAADRVDPGTRVLLDLVPSPPMTGDLLDLGCGYGPIALSLAVRAPGATVWAVDVNERARELTAMNARASGLANVRTCAPEAVPSAVTFAAIWSNPPIRVGITVLHHLLRQWLSRLADDGEAWLVVARNLGADSLVRWLVGVGFPAERTRSRKGYGLLRVGAGSRQS